MARRGRVERLDAHAFHQERLDRPGTWVVAFVADWCPFCRDFATRFDALEWKGDIHLAHGDVTDEESPLWDSFHLDVVPTVVVFRDGATVFRKDGVLGHGLSDADLHTVHRALGASSA